MSIDTSGSPVTAAAESTVPVIRHFQMGDDAIGRISESVNLFRGNVAFPIELVALEGRAGLAAGVNIAYESEVHRDVDTWNQEAPTGVLGLGWSMDTDQIVRDVSGSLSPFLETFYLSSSEGGTTRLWQTSGGAEWEFEVEGQPFWKVRYTPAAERWEVTSPDGLVRVYGGDAAALQHGVHWGGADGSWTGPSIQAGQQRFVLAWSLSELRNRWADRITFDYTPFDDDEIPVGPGGQKYTRAVYLRGITDPAGRTVRFNYLPMRSDAEVREYQAPHVPPAPGRPQAHQDRYQTRYLDSITVAQQTAPGREETLFSVRFSYSLDRFSNAPGDPAALVKRYLRAITVVNAHGKLRPGMRFDYYDGTEAAPGGEVHRGALKRITYPEGGAATFTYEAVGIRGTALSRTLGRHETGGGVPRVWFGPTYAVVLRYDEAAGRRLAVNVYDWNGRWVGTRPLDLRLAGALDLSTLNVAARDDWFLLTYETRRGPSEREAVAHAVRRGFGRWGAWEATPLPMPALLSPGAGWQVDAGDGFVVAAADDVPEVRRYTWDAPGWTWRAAPLRVEGGGEVVLAAQSTFFALAHWQPQAAQARLTLHYMDVATLEWGQTRLDDVPALWDDELPKLSWAVSETFAAATFLTGKDARARTVGYEVRTYAWDRYFRNVRTQRRAHDAVPANSVEPFFASAASGSMVGNASNLLRYNGNAWVEASMGQFNLGRGVAQFAYDSDLAIGTGDARSVAVAYDPFQDRIVPIASFDGGEGPMQPTINGPLVSIRSVLYLRGPDGRLRQIGQLPRGAEELANDGASYVAYRLQDGSSWVHTVRNGSLAPSAVRLPGSAFPQAAEGAGTALTGSTAFAVFNGPSFDAAESITLHRVLAGQVEGAVGGFLVTKVEVDDGFGERSYFSFAYPGEGCTGPFGLASQYTEVKSVSGSAAAGVAPFGWTLSTFHNDLVPPSDAADVTPYAFLSGMLRRAEQFDASGTRVSKTDNTYEVVRTARDIGGRSRPLFGAYVRPVSEVATSYDPAQPGLELASTTRYDYVEWNGLPRSTTTWNVTPAGDEEIRTTTTYLPEKYPAAVALNMISAAVHTLTTVNGQPVGAEATLWKRWATTDGARQAWAPYQTCAARAGDAQLLDSDWAGGTVPSPAAWKPVVAARVRDPHGNVLEAQDEDGLLTSYLFDAGGRVCVSSFGAAGLDQVAYLGFESYEEMAGWTLGGRPEAVAPAVVEGDAHSGSRALRLTGGSGATGALERTLTPPSPAETYVLSCWVKTPDGFGAAAGDAALKVSWAGDEAELPVPDTGGMWLYVFLTVPLPAGRSSPQVTLSIRNEKPAALLVDDVRFSPLLADWDGVAFDPASLRPQSTFVTSGQTRMVGFGDFDETRFEIDEGFAFVTYGSRSLSCRGNGGAFDAASPNASLTVSPQAWGLLQSFTLGDGWQTDWQSADFGRWVPEGGALVHQPGQEDRLTYYSQDFLPGEPSYGFTLRVRPVGALTGGVGLAFGAAARLGWDPAQAAWWLDTGSGPVRSAPRASLRLGAADHGADLDGGVLSPALLGAFARGGLPLSSASTVSVVASGTSWRVQDAGGATVYYLVADGAQPSGLAVVTFPTEWTLLVLGTDVVFFADGERVLSYRDSQPVSGGLGIFATDRVAFDNVAIFTDPTVELSYQDGASRTRQEQVWDTAGPIATAAFFDELSRPGVTTQAARLAQAGGAVLAYDPGLAAFDRATLKMTGKVAAQNPDAGDFAYARTRYEASPLGREVEKGLPGAELAITGAGNAHTTRMTYGLSDGTVAPYGKGKLFQATTMDPDGVTAVTLTDLRGRTVATGVLASRGPATYDVSRQTYDPAGNLVRAETPRGWADTFTYDFLGRCTREELANSTHPTLMAYDSRGWLRFRQTPAGAAASPPYVDFLRYDALARLTEEGVHACAWSEAAAKVDDPAWPAAPAAVVYGYDVPDRDGDLLAIGKLASVTSSHQAEAPGGSDAFTAVEETYYDVWTQLVKRTLSVTGAGASFAGTYTVTYDYDNQGRWVGIHYPTKTGAPAESPEAAWVPMSSGLVVAPVFDPIGRVHRLELSDGRVVRYTYDPNGWVTTESGAIRDGTPESASFNETKVFERTCTYGPTGWLKSTADNGFRADLTYTGGGMGGAGWYSGNVASIRVAARGGRAEQTMRFAYDVKGQLSDMQLDASPADTYAYDANGNVTRLDSRALTYTDAQRDRLHDRPDEGGKATYSWDADGRLAAVSGTAAASLSIGYDAWRGRALRVVHGAAELSLRYGEAGRRLWKQVSGSPARSTLYVRGFGEGPLIEVDAAGEISAAYVSGPTGPVLVYSGATPFWVSRDQIGSVRALMDEAGVLAAGFDYRPYGELQGAPLGSRPDDFRYRFTNRERDESGLYDLRGRLYDPASARFVSQDPGRQFSSPYLYVGNNPLRLVDPDGEFLPVAILIAMGIGALIGGISGGIAAAQTISARNLKGSDAAGVIFGMVGLGMGVGAATGALTWGAGSAIGSLGLGGVAETALNIGASSVSGAALSAAESAGQAALSAGDAGQAALQGAAIGAVSALAGGIVGAGAEVVHRAAGSGTVMKALTDSSGKITGVGVQKNTAAGIPKNWRVDMAFAGAGAVLGAAAGSGVAAAMNGDSAPDALVSMLQGAAFGIAGAMAEGMSGRLRESYEWRSANPEAVTRKGTVKHKTLNDDTMIELRARTELKSSKPLKKK
jgi:RHS repeat-associated protein